MISWKEICRHHLEVGRKPLSLLQALPESGQLFLVGSGLIVVGLLVRAVRRLLLSSMPGVTMKHGTEQP